ncbi:MAG: hypothetical protein ACLTXE_01205 [Enterocloster aldenensis]
MADISKEINDFRTAVYGRDVRNSMISLAEKVNTEVETNTTNVNAAVSTANEASGKANQTLETAQEAINEAATTLQEANTAKTDAKSSASAAAESANSAEGSKNEAAQSAEAAAESAAEAEQIAEGLGGFKGSAASVTAVDTQGLVVGEGGNTNAQALFNALALKVAQELVSNTELAQQLASYVAKTGIVQTESTATDTVPSSAYLKSVKDTINSNLGAELVTNDILSYALGVGRGFYVIRTDNTTANTPKDYMSGYIVKRFGNPNQVTIVLFELGKTKPYYNSYNGSAWSGWNTGLQDADFARESTDLNTAFNGIGAISMYNWSSATLHTPYKEGITVYGNGFAIGFDVGSFKVQVTFVVGENRIFIRSLRDGGAFSTWVAK